MKCQYVQTRDQGIVKVLENITPEALCQIKLYLYYYKVARYKHRFTLKFKFKAVY
jgi:hypothetical protein